MYVHPFGCDWDSTCVAWETSRHAHTIHAAIIRNNGNNVKYVTTEFNYLTITPFLHFPSSAQYQANQGE